MTERILLLEHKDYNPEAIRILEEIGPVEFYDGAGRPEYYEHITILVSRLAYLLDEAFLRQFPRVHTIATATTGLTHVDLDYCRRRNIEIVSLKGEREFLREVTATAELAIALVLNLVRMIPASIQSVVHDHAWNRDEFRGRELSGLTCGILGFGRLGQQMTVYARAFGMKTLAADPFVHPSVFEQHHVVRCSTEELFQRCDVITLHVNYERENHNMVSAREFSSMKPGGYFVNTSRGELVDESALLDALSTGHLAGAALDVLKDEHQLPAMFSGDIFRYASTHSNLLITPHIGGCTLDSMHKTESFIAKKLQGAMKNRS